MKKLFLCILMLVVLAGCGNNAAKQPGGSGETGVSEYADIYIDAFDAYFDVDPELGDDMEYLAIDMDTLEHATEADKREITDHFKEKFGVEVKDASFEDLEKQGLVYEGNYIDGILLYVSKIEVGGSSITIEGTKFRSGIGADGIKSTFEREGGQWILKNVDLIWIS